jgi:hypothetical protein
LTISSSPTIRCSRPLVDEAEVDARLARAAQVERGALAPALVGVQDFGLHEVSEEHLRRWVRRAKG